MIWFGIAIVTGLCFGSFANVLIHRVPRGLSIVVPASACTACNSPIKPYDLLPIISWLVLWGRCRNCKAPISVTYPLVEIACALIFAGMLAFTFTLSAIFLSLLGFILLVVSVIDAHTQEIPDGLVIAAAVIGIVWVVLGHVTGYFPHAPGFFGAGLGILTGGLPLLIIDKLVQVALKKDGFGHGDVKLMAVCGIFLGWQLTLVAFFFAFVTGGMYASFLLISGRGRRGDYIAFGPFLSAGTIAAIWGGNAFLSMF